MAGPFPVPADKADADVWGASDVNLINDHLGWMRDDRPAFRGAAIGDAFLAPGSAVEWGFGTAPETFFASATMNVGSWTVAANPNSDGYYNLVVPASGIYSGVWKARFDADTAGSRQLSPQLNGNTISYSSTVVTPALAGSATIMAAPFLVDASKDAELSLHATQNSGSGLKLSSVSLSIYWAQAT